MKQLRISIAVLFVFSFLLGFSEKSLAQAGGTNPELVMYRHNSGPGGALPIIAGDHLGNLKWNGLTQIGQIRTGASIQSFTTAVSPGILYANLIFRTAGVVPPDPTVGLHDRMIITQEGRVGIGTNTPSNTSGLNFKLHTIGNTHTSGDFYGRIHFDQSFLSGQNIINNVINNFAPSDYDDEAYFELKDRAVLISPGIILPPGGLTVPSGANNQGGLLSLGPGGTSGNISFDHQLFFGDDGIFTRRKTGDDASWGGAFWFKILTSENISGNGGRLPRFTGPLGSPSNSLGNSQLFDDGVDNVVIGENHPPTPPATIDSDYRLTVNGLPTGAARINGNTRMEGNLGIGLAPTTNRLEVSGNSQFNGNVGMTGNLDVDLNANIDGSLQVDGNGRIDGNLGIGKAPHVTFDLDVAGESNFDGRVKVGASAFPTFIGASSYELVVGGGVLAEEVLVRLQSNWPDYVFDKNYALMPLTEVEQLTKQNSHLPGVPTATEIAENGLNLGEMQKVQMEKIEELFLHVIALEKRVNNLENRNQELELENKKLKSELVKH